MRIVELIPNSPLVPRTARPFYVEADGKRHYFRRPSEARAFIIKKRSETK